MKKNRYILILIAVLVLTGCSKKVQMTDFIPTVIPGGESSEEVTPTGTAAVASETSEVTQAPKTVYAGETSTKYVKLDEYDDVLNVRPDPSTASAPIGFLVHTEEIDVIEIKDGWASFVYKDAIGYVNADYLVDEKPDYLDPPTPTAAPKSKEEAKTDTDGPQI